MRCWLDERVTLKELIQRGLATIKSIHLIRCCKLVNRCVAMAQPSTPGSRSKLFALVTVLPETPLLFALAQLAKRFTRQHRQGFARRSPEFDS